MNELQAQEYIDTYEEAIDVAPPEVRDFLWSDAFKGIIEGFKKEFSLTEAQAATVSEIMHDAVLGLAKEDESVQKMTDAGISDETQDKIIQLGYALIVAPSAQEAQNTAQEESDFALQPPQTPIEVAANIQDRLKASRPTSAIEREYNAPLATPAPTPAPQIPKKDPTSDPYHEPIE
jgi:hypothetical protein